MSMERLIGKSWMPCAMKDIRRGDVFRCTEGGRGPILIAATDAELRDSPRRPGKKVWHVKIETG